MASVQFSRRVLARTIATRLMHEPKRQMHWMQVLAAYLIEQKRVHEAELIVNDITHELFEQNGQLPAHVTSARALTSDLRMALKKVLAAQTGAKEVVLTEKTDPALLGGLIARTPDAELDGSVRTTLNRLATIN